MTASAMTATSPFASIPSATLRELASALEDGLISIPPNALSLQKYVGEGPAKVVTQCLQHYLSQGLSGSGLASMCRLIVSEREAVSAQRAQPELVWTGPETPGAASRDTAIVVRQMLQSAQQSVVMSTYNVFDARSIFAPLAARMAELPGLEVKLYVNLTSDRELKMSEAAYAQLFLSRFRQHSWPGGRLPRTYYDRRLFHHPSSVLHAKCVVIDGRDVLVSSANLSAPAYGEEKQSQGENIEAGIRLEDAVLARHLLRQFEALEHLGILVPLGAGGGV